MLTFAFDLIKGLGTLSSTIAFMFAGLSLGCISFNGIVRLWDERNSYFCKSYARGYALLSFLYFVVEMTISGYFGFYDIFIIIISIVGLAILVAVMALISHGNDSWLYPLGLSGLPLIVKTSHTSYFVIDKILNQDNSSGEYIFLLISLIFELLLLMFWTLWAFLNVKVTGKKSIPFTVWSLEYSDLISHIVVCMVYANEIKTSKLDWNDPIMATYFAFFIINLYVWTVPLYFVTLSAVNGNASGLIGLHIAIVDTITDIPMAITTLVGRTYVGNIYIMIDLAVKIILLLRGIIWAPIVFIWGNIRFDNHHYIDHDDGSLEIHMHAAKK